MNNTKFTKILSLLACVVLIAAMALIVTGCNEQPVAPATETDTITHTDATVVGKGNTSFAFTVVDGQGNKTHFTVNTDQTTVGAALLENNLIEGEDGDYGLYVKKVNGITADYDVDGTYWAFYVNDEYATAGVDTTNVTPGATYMFKVEK